MVALGVIQRDGSNLKVTTRGHLFLSDRVQALREAVHGFELYRSTVEWLRYQGKSQATAVEIGQYWENSHADTLGERSGSTLKSGAVCFGRVVEGAGLGTFVVGRGGKETRLAVDPEAVIRFVDGTETQSVDPGKQPDEPPSPGVDLASATPSAQDAEVRPASPGEQKPTVSLSASPNVHVNVEIHIAANATDDTVREIFRNMARYVLDKPIDADET